MTLSNNRVLSIYPFAFNGRVYNGTILIGTM